MVSTVFARSLEDQLEDLVSRRSDCLWLARVSKPDKYSVGLGGLCAKILLLCYAVIPGKPLYYARSYYSSTLPEASPLCCTESQPVLRHRPLHVQACAMHMALHALCHLLPASRRLRLPSFILVYRQRHQYC